MAARDAARNLIQRDASGVSVRGRAAPMLVAELADRLAYTPDHFRRNIARLMAEAGMPAPLLAIGQRRWNRGEIEAWLAHRTPPRAANDAAPRGPDERTWRDTLAAEYGRAR